MPTRPITLKAVGCTSAASLGNLARAEATEIRGPLLDEAERVQQPEKAEQDRRTQEYGPERPVRVLEERVRKRL